MTHTDGHLGEPSDRLNPIDKIYVSTGGVLKELEVDEVVFNALNGMSLPQQKTALLNALNNIR